MSIKVRHVEGRTPSRFDYFWKGFLERRLLNPRKGRELADQQAVARAAFESGWEAAGGGPHKSQSTCQHENVRGIAVVPRPCPSCGKPVF